MILKKFLLLIGLLLIFNSSSMALENTQFEIVKKTGSFIDFSSTVKPKTWIGLYKKGTSNEWANVLAWGWVKNAQTRISKISHFAEGDYEARLFFNNSYTTEISLDFHVGKNPGNQEARLVNTSASVYEKTFQLPIKKTKYVELNDWVGVFKKGLSHTQENLLAWSYVKKNDRYIQMSSIHEKGLSLGIYDLVYFTANSYQEDGPTAELTVEASICHGKFRDSYHGKSVLTIRNYNLFKQSNDWVAIFKNNENPTRENILYWAYVKDGETIDEKKNHITVYFPSLENHDLDYSFKIVLFEKDTYNILGTSHVSECDD